MDGASGGAKAIGDPEGLLRSALEKIVFFECRVAQLESELAAARGVAERARDDAAKAHRREIELDRTVAGERGARADAERRSSELDERVRLLEAERERLLAGLVERARVSGAPDASGAPGPEEGGADLAGFIAELRAEIDALRAFKAAAEAAGFRAEAGAAPSPAASRPPPASTVTDLAARFEDAGRVGLSARDAAQMKDLLTTRADRTLYERSMDDLSAADAGKRLRAVRALEALGSKASAPLLVAALGREPDPEVKAGLLATLARLGEPFAADLAARELSDARPAVRVAALDALAAVAHEKADEPLAGALADPSPLVRRRAALLLGFARSERAETALASALADPDRGVARAAAAALAGRPSARAQGALTRGLEHADASVRRTAAAALSRLSGERVDADGPASARRAASRRIAEKLAGMGGDEIRAAVLEGADAVAPEIAPPTPTLSPRAAGGEGDMVAVRAAGGEGDMVAVRAAGGEGASEAEGQGEGTSALEAGIVGELRAALRGSTAEALSAALGSPRSRVDAALRSLEAAGAVAIRGARWFTS